MWKQKMCMNISPAFGLGAVEQIKLLKKIGFDGFFSEYTNDEDIAEQKRIADEVGMIFQSIHAPYVKMNQMWTENADVAVSELIDCVKACAKNDVPIMVAHTFIGFKDHTPTDIGLKNFEKVVNVAKDLGVKVAFENTEGEEYLFAVMDYFKNEPYVGFCLDTGHEMCYNHSRDLLALFGDRLIATHINDNLGIRDFDGEITYIDDLHLLPFDGVADWQGIVDRLNANGYDGLLTFELGRTSKPHRLENDFYAEMPIEKYLTLAYMRACRVATMKLKK